MIFGSILSLCMVAVTPSGRFYHRLVQADTVCAMALAPSLLGRQRRDFVKRVLLVLWAI